MIRMCLLLTLILCAHFPYSPLSSANDQDPRCQSVNRRDLDDPDFCDTFCKQLKESPGNILIQFAKDTRAPNALLSAAGGEDAAAARGWRLEKLARILQPRPAEEDLHTFVEQTVSGAGHQTFRGQLNQAIKGNDSVFSDILNNFGVGNDRSLSVGGADPDTNVLKIKHLLSLSVAREQFATIMDHADHEIKPSLYKDIKKGNRLFPGQAFQRAIGQLHFFYAMKKCLPEDVDEAQRKDIVDYLDTFILPEVPYKDEEGED